MQIDFSIHAEAVMRERAIQEDWVVRVLACPEVVEPDPVQPNAFRAFGRVAEFGNRMLRVVYCRDGTRCRIITVFFDRSRTRGSRAK